jgi:hypothetical protein
MAVAKLEVVSNLEINSIAENSGGFRPDYWISTLQKSLLNI